MKYEEAIKSLDDPFCSDIYVWRMQSQRLFCRKRSVLLFVVSFEFPHLFKVCEIAKDTTADQLRLQIKLGLFGPLGNESVDNWRVGTPEDMIRGVLNSGIRL